MSGAGGFIREPGVRGDVCGIADLVFQRSVSVWGEKGAVRIVGRSRALVEALERLSRFAAFDEPVLIGGESGVGKELAAKALHLLSRRRGPLVAVNCPQYREGNVTVSELFGHEKGSFTGAYGRRRGCFEQADGGTVFLDEVGDLHMDAQVMLLRTLSSGEVQPLGSQSTRQVEVRVAAATNRPLEQMVDQGIFRHDLFYRLRRLVVELPPLRQRGDDWKLLLESAMSHLSERYGQRKRFSARSMRLLEDYDWPGNVRELLSVASIGYAMCDGHTITPSDVEEVLVRSQGTPDTSRHLLERMGHGEGDFWELVHRPFLDRDLNRSQVQRIVELGLRRAGSYQALLPAFGLANDEYQKFMDCLRHHRLKPDAVTPAGTASEGRSVQPPSHTGRRQQHAENRAVLPSK